MGADYKDQGEAIEELSALSSAAKQCLLHHICNALNGVIGGIQIGRNDLALDAAWHIVADLEMMGIRSTKTQIREVWNSEEKITQPSTQTAGQEVKV